MQSVQGSIRSKRQEACDYCLQGSETARGTFESLRACMTCRESYSSAISPTRVGISHHTGADHRKLPPPAAKPESVLREEPGCRWWEREREPPGSMLSLRMLGMVFDLRRPVRLRRSEALRNLTAARPCRDSRDVSDDSVLLWRIARAVRGASESGGAEAAGLVSSADSSLDSSMIRGCSSSCCCCCAT